MPKIKTHKATVKRFRKTSHGKFMMRQTGQDHFNARDYPTKTMGKRRDIKIAKTNLKAIKKLIPYYRNKKYAR